jgi:hypothetical protein
MRRSEPEGGGLKNSFGGAKKLMQLYAIQGRSAGGAQEGPAHPREMAAPPVNINNIQK